MLCKHIHKQHQQDILSQRKFNVFMKQIYQQKILHYKSSSDSEDDLNDDDGNGHSHRHQANTVR